MNVLLVLTSILVAVIADEDKFPAKYDDFDVKAVLNNERLYKQYLGCFLGEKPCTEEGKFLKEVLPNSLADNCAKCTEKQQATAEEVFHFLSEKYPKDFNRLMDEFDKTGAYRERYQKIATDKGIKLPK